MIFKNAFVMFTKCLFILKCIFFYKIPCNALHVSSLKRPQNHYKCACCLLLYFLLKAILFKTLLLQHHK